MMHVSMSSAALLAAFICRGHAITDQTGECRVDYSVTLVVEGPDFVQADLDLVGNGCHFYGPDIAELSLLVEYQTGKFRGGPHSHTQHARCFCEDVTQRR